MRRKAILSTASHICLGVSAHVTVSYVRGGSASCRLLLYKLPVPSRPSQVSCPSLDKRRKSFLVLRYRPTRESDLVRVSVAVVKY